LQTTGPVLLPDFLPPFSSAAETKSGTEPEESLEQLIEARITAGAEGLYAEAVHRLDRLLLTRVLQHTNGNQVQAAKMLGITRGSLRTKIRELGIRIDRNVSTDN
jgi:two-component system nitrogen regulation response regulator GlnG